MLFLRTVLLNIPLIFVLSESLWVLQVLLWKTSEILLRHLSPIATTCILWSPAFLSFEWYQCSRHVVPVLSHVKHIQALCKTTTTQLIWCHFSKFVPIYKYSLYIYDINCYMLRSHCGFYIHITHWVYVVDCPVA